MIKLVLTDMDGTLVKSNFEIPVEIHSVFEQLLEKGVYCGIATGRSLGSLKRDFKRNFANLTIIAENGAVISHKGKIIHVETTDATIMKNVKELVAGRYCIVASGLKTAYIEKEFAFALPILQHHFPAVDMVDDLCRVDDEILEISLYLPDGNAASFVKELEPFKEDYTVVYSGADFIDIFAKDLNKGRSLQKLQELLNITKEETMAFGDYMNDYELLKNAGESYAVANAVEPVKEIAKHVIGSNDDLAVIQTLKQEFALK
ncbi:hypothetical protein A4S06_00775 [Erysipelotrichaceae bacterium MTC7]|nr:hypothetical protein A4S06_00775 [Erysipelotrichaceae bacterium MTC7]